MRRSILMFLFAISVATQVLAAPSDPLPEPTREGTPKMSPESVYNKGLALSQAGDFSGAEVAYREAIVLNPQLPEAWNGLGHALKKQKRYADALAAYDKALKLRPNFALAMQYLGELYVETGEMDKAHALLAKLRPLDEENADKLTMAIVLGSSRW